MEATGQKEMSKAMLLFLGPLVISNALESASTTISSILLGRLIGIQALAVVSAFFPVFFFLISFVIGAGSGSSILIGQSHGAGDQDKLKTVMGTTLTFTFILGLVLAIIGHFAAAPLLRLIGTPADILADSIVFSQGMFWGLPVIFLYAVYTTFLRGVGDSKTPMYFLIISIVLSVLLTVPLVMGWGRLPPLGVVGSAYATIVADGICLFMLLLYLVKSDHPLRFEFGMLHYLRLNKEILKLLLKLGIPSSIQMLFISLSEIAVVSLVNQYGSTATAAYGAVNQVISYVEMPVISLGIAVSIFGAQSIGAGEGDKLKKVIRAGFLLNIIVGGSLILLTYFFAREVLSLFLADEKTLATAHALLLLTLWGYPFLGNIMVLSGVMRSSGDVLWPTVITIGSIWGIFVPAAYYLSGYYGLAGIWIAYPIEFFCGMLLEYAYYRMIWQKKLHNRLV